MNRRSGGSSLKFRWRSRRRGHRPPAPRSVQGALQPSQTWDDDRFSQELTTLEQAIATLRQRFQYHQLQGQQAALSAQLAAPEAEGTDPQAQLHADLQAIQAQLATLEATLEAQHLTWGVWVEPFWQAVRFGGVGIVIGWMLRAIVQGN